MGKGPLEIWWVDGRMKAVFLESLSCNEGKETLKETRSRNAIKSQSNSLDKDVVSENGRDDVDEKNNDLTTWPK